MKLVVPKYKYLIQGFVPILLVYLYMFQPPVLITKYVYIAAEFLLLMSYVVIKDKFFFLDFFKSFKIEVFLLFLIISYSLIIDLFVGEEVYVFRFVAWAFQAFIIGYLIIKIFKFNFHNLFSTFYWAAFLASCITLILAFNPVADLFYQAIQLDEVPIFEKMTVRHRAFGASENLTFTYSFVLGFFAGYTLTVLWKNMLLIVPFFFLFLGVMYNARIGFIPIGLFVIYMVLKKDIKSFFLFFLLIFSIGAGSAFFFPEFVDVIFFNKNWALEFFYDIGDTLFGSSNTSQSTIKTLTDDFIIFPDTLFSWIFGTGESLFTKRGMNSDVGYIIQLYYGGIILMVLIIALMIYFFTKLILKNGFLNWFTIVFCFSLLILNFKGFIFAATPGGRMLFLFYMCLVLNSNKINENHTISTRSF